VPTGNGAAVEKIVITGGTGFIGSHLTAGLLHAGHKVIALSRTKRFSVPDILTKEEIAEVEIVQGDMTDAESMLDLVNRSDVIFHKAANQGVSALVENAQDYLNTNIGAAATLVDVLRRSRSKPRMIVLGSSVSVYGEGCYACPSCGIVRPALRYTRPDKSALPVKSAPVGKRGQTDKNVQAGKREQAGTSVDVGKSEQAGTSVDVGKSEQVSVSWNPPCPKCGGNIEPVPTGENAERLGESVYAVAKKAQEDLLSGACSLYGITLVNMRYGTIIGAGQSWHNPFTRFLDLLSAGDCPALHEDGCQTRDFIFVEDVVAANLLALEKVKSSVNNFNAGSGRQVTLLEFTRGLAQLISSSLGTPLCEPNLDQTFIPGDIRHCYVSCEKISHELGFKAATSLEDGSRQLVDWYLRKRNVAAQARVKAV
jgi:dTDP-L-rhamnose 4-epimerase